MINVFLYDKQTQKWQLTIKQNTLLIAIIFCFRQLIVFLLSQKMEMYL